MNTPNKKSPKILMKFALLNLIVLFFAAGVSAKPKNLPELVVAGDSWANFLCDDRGYQKTFDHLKVSNLKEHDDCKSTSKNGLEAGEWMQSEQHGKLLEKLFPGTRIQYVHLSIGGNDLIARWKVYMTTEQEIELFERNFGFIKSIIDSLLNKNGQIKVILSGYDFPRFTTDHPIAEFRKALANMGNPSPFELNSALIRYHQYLIRRLLSHADFQKRIFAIHHLGMQHYYDGIQDAQVGSGQTLHPDDISSLIVPESVGGDPHYMTNKKSLKKWFAGIYDAFHLGETGNKRLAEHVYRNIIRFQ